MADEVTGIVIGSKVVYSLKQVGDAKGKLVLPQELTEGKVYTVAGIIPTTIGKFFHLEELPTVTRPSSDLFGTRPLIPAEAFTLAPIKK